MSIIHLTEASSGAPRNSGTNGDLCVLLDWALVTNGGWSIVQTAANARVYKPIGGNGFLLYVNHDSAVSGAAQLATVRGCETATAASEAGVVNPFPTIAEIAATSATWLVSSLASTVTRNFDIYVTSTFVIYISNINGTTINDIQMWGDISPTLAGDIYNTVCSSRNGTGTTTAVGYTCTNSGVVQGTLHLWMCRSYDGTVKSTTASIVNQGGANLGAVNATSAAFLGATGLIDRQKCQVLDTGATTTTFATAKGVVNRGWIPNLWNPVHASNGTVNNRDTFTDTSYNGSAVFVNHMTVSTGWAIVENSNTWNAPSG